MKPIIAIVGRPNVGKSTLFNRIVGSRKAITLDQSGVSRDRLYAPASWNGHEFLCVDTGGFPSGVKSTLHEKIQRQIERAIAEAQVILFTLDGASGLLTVDAEIADQLRRSGKKVFTVVNKIDRESHEPRLADFYSVSPKLFPISAEHGYQTAELLDAVVKELPPAEPEKNPNEIRVAIIGRPNVGKSSLVNQLLGEERVVVDASPGTTRDVIDSIFTHQGQTYRLLDTAGIRRKGKWDNEIERYSVLKALQEVERADVCLLLLDASAEITKQDAHVAGYAAQAKKGIVIVWNKWDLIAVKRGVEKDYQQKVAESLRFLSYAPILTVSAKTGWGLKEIWPTVRTLYQACQKRIKTSDVNRVFEEIIDAHNRPVYKGMPVKFMYATQNAVHPPTFVVFVNEPKGVHFSYQRYLVNEFRKAFGFGGAPIEMIFRKKT